MHTFLTIVGAVLCAAVLLGIGIALGAWRTHGVLDDALTGERRQRRAAQAETARALGRQDWLIWSGRAARSSLHAMFLDWTADHDTTAIVLAKALDDITQLEAFIREEGIGREAINAEVVPMPQLAAGNPLGIETPIAAEIEDEAFVPTWMTVTGMHPDALRENRTGEISRELIAAALAEAGVA